MTCARCRRYVPADRIACDCYVLRADREQRSLALSRFLCGRGPAVPAAAGTFIPPGGSVRPCADKQC